MQVANNTRENLRSAPTLITATKAFSHGTTCDSDNVYLCDEVERRSKTVITSKFTYRSHTCGELRLEHVGLTVSLCGWIEFRRMNKFVVLRDSYGHTQLLIKSEVSL